MTPREAMIANIECRSDGRIGFCFSGERLRDIIDCALTYTWDDRAYEDDRFHYSTDRWGNEWFRVKGLSAGGEILKPAIEDWSQLDSLQLPDLANPANFKKVRDRVSSATDLFRLGWMSWPFAVCRYLRKMEVYFTDLVLERENIDRLHDRVTTLLDAVITQYGEAGVDGIMFCEDLGVQDRLLMSPEMWRDIFRPLYERLTSRAHEYGMKVIQHSCGYNWFLVDDLCEAGIDCLQFDQPAVYDQPALAEKLRKHGVGLFSPCDIQKVLPTGDRAFIEQETKRLVDTFRGGFIAKNYGDLHGIGVEPEWDQWAYEAFIKYGGGDIQVCQS